MANFLVNELNPSAIMPYDSDDARLGDYGLGMFDPNFKGVTHDGVCLHTCPSYYDDAGELADANYGPGTSLDTGYHAPYVLHVGSASFVDKCYRQYDCPAASIAGPDYFAASALDLGYITNRDTGVDNTGDEAGILLDKFECIKWDKCTNIDENRTNPGGFNTENYVYHAVQHFDHFVIDGAELGSGSDYAGDAFVGGEMYTLIEKNKVTQGDLLAHAIYWPNVADYGTFTRNLGGSHEDHWEHYGFAAGNNPD